MLVMVGAVNVVQGLVALFRGVLRRRGSEGPAALLDFTAWGVVLLIWGGAQVGAGLGLNRGHGWARVLA